MAASLMAGTAAEAVSFFLSFQWDFLTNDDENQTRCLGCFFDDKFCHGNIFWPCDFFDNGTIITIILMIQVVEGKGKLMDNLSNYIIVDIGANLTNKKFSRDLDQVIQRATDSGEAEDDTFISQMILYQRSELSITWWFNQIVSFQAPEIRGHSGYRRSLRYH